MRHEPPEHVDRAAHAVIGAALEVHRAFGPGFAESVYENALCLELEARRIPHQRQVRVPLRYRGTDVGAHILDVLVAGVLVVELKAVEMLGSLHTAQVNAYLRATGLRLALIINFNATLLRSGVRRIISSAPASEEHIP